MIGDRGSVSGWLDDLRAGDQAAAGRLWGRYFDRLVRLAGTRRRASRATSAESDEEDAALSAFGQLLHRRDGGPVRPDG